jgi:hypothetical protein
MSNSTVKGEGKMNVFQWRQPLWLQAIALFAVLFGLLTLSSGGSVLFNSAARQVTGNYVGFIVWFNFLAGFAYIIAGIGLWRQQPWAVWLSFFLAGATLLAFIAFGLYVLSGGSYETRTVAAMSLRTLVWFIIGLAAYWRIGQKNLIRTQNENCC